MQYLILSLVLTLISSCASAIITSQKIVQIESGKIEGTKKGSVVSFKGIPYAKPPVGSLRWRAPQLVSSWDGVKFTKKYASDCMQKPFPSDAAPLGTKPSEDCLYLNVWKPESAQNSKLPVMFWIHGGGWVNGGASPQIYSGENFAKRGVILVSINYRLGRFGFFAHPELTTEAKKLDHGHLGNYGYMDQIFALKWVQRNIEAFGGDPNNVTIFGESAGGGSVLAMLTSPETKGLFHKAIIQSGGGRNTLGGDHYVGQSNGSNISAEKAGLNFAKLKGIEAKDKNVLKKLRALSPKDIVNDMNMVNMGAQSDTYVGAMIDGKILTESHSQTFRKKNQNMVPVMSGATSGDLGLGIAVKNKVELFNLFEQDAKLAKKLYDPTGKISFKSLLSEVARQKTMLEPSRYVVEQMSDANQPSWYFRFSYVPENSRDQGLLAPHATDVPFTFNTVKDRYSDELTKFDVKIASQMNQYWVNFAKTGNPNGVNLAQWPKYSPDTKKILEFSNQGVISGKDKIKTKLDLIEQYLND